MARTTGTYKTISTAGEAAEAFVPHPLPPRDPPLDLGGALGELHSAALTALARLEVAARLVPSTDWFTYGFVRKEAVISSRIEGTQATLRDVVTYEATSEASDPDDVEEVCNYVDALTYARRQLARRGGLPLSSRLLCEAHRRLMRGVRGGDKDPGRFRRAQNWVGGSSPTTARFVPPPPEDVAEGMAALERWIHSDDPLPPVVKAGLAHVQFETIHPFLDGNGRIGRLLIALLLEHWSVLPSPVLYLSLAFKRRQREYYDRLSAVRTDGDWEGWTAFYLACVREAADDGVDVAGRLSELTGRDRRRLASREDSTVPAVRLLDMLPEHPVITVPLASKLLSVTAPTARKAIDVLEAGGVLRETTGRRRDRVFAYHKYLQILTGDEA
jgi:Fic family protein